MSQTNDRLFVQEFIWAKMGMYGNVNFMLEGEDEVLHGWGEV